MKSLFVFLFIGSTIISYAQSGTIDKSYGVNKTGTVSASSKLILLSSAIQQDGKLVLAGKDTTVGKFIIACHNNDGSIDSAFGKNGQTTVTINDLVQNVRSTSGWVGVSLQSDGKIVTVGSVSYNNSQNNIFFDDDIVVARFLPDGTPDESFGSHGRVVTELGYLEDANAITVQADGKILVAGEQTKDFNGNGSGVLLLRYNSDGTLDDSFGGEGFVKYTNTDGNISQANAVLIQPDGKIVAAGWAGAMTNYFILRYFPDGTLDEAFGNNGTIKTASQSTGAQINSIALDYKGRIVAAGVYGFNAGIDIFRYLSNGSLDKSFDNDGHLQLVFNIIPYAYANVSTILAQQDDKLIVSSAISSDGLVVTEVLSGLNEDGSFDVSFGTDKGQTISNFGLTNDFLAPAAMQSDGKIIVSGNNIDYTTYINTYLLTRFNGYPVHVSLAVRIKRFIHNHSIIWNGLPADDHIAYYSVEQSSLSSKGFTPIAKLSGRSNLRDYSISNSNLLQGTNYYRVKAVSTDGTIRYSEVVSADYIANTASVFPNPAKSYVTVQGLATNATANISIKDGSGTILTRGTSSGSTQYRSQVSNLLPGTYYLNITTAGKTETLPFVKE